MRPITVYVGPLAAASANNIAASQTVASNGAVTLNGSAASGGVATLDMPRQVGITSAGNDSGLMFTLSGTDNAGNLNSETITGANAGVALSVLSYKSVTLIKASGATASTITIGTTGIADSPWVRFDNIAIGPIQAAFTVTGTVNYTLYTSMDDPNSPNYDPSLNVPIAPSAVSWDLSGTPIVGNTATATVTIPSVTIFAKVRLNSGAGSVKCQFVGPLAS